MRRGEGEKNEDISYVVSRRKKQNKNRRILTVMVEINPPLGALPFKSVELLG